MKKSFLTAIFLGLSLTLATPVLAAAPQSVPVREFTKILTKEGGTIFPIGQYNSGYARYFTGDSYLSVLAKDGVPVMNVTFAKGAHTFWHKHHKTCQILLAESGHGYYQIWGQPAQALQPGQVVTIPEGVKHWHGAAPGSMFQHVVVMEPVQGASTEWLEPVDAKDYAVLPIK